MKKVLSLITVAFLAVATSSSAYACHHWEPCTPPPSHHGVSEPLGMLAILTAVSVYFVARKRA